MGYDDEDVGVVGQDTGNIAGFRGVNWNVESFEPNKKGGDGGRVGIVV